MIERLLKLRKSIHVALILIKKDVQCPTVESLTDDEWDQVASLHTFLLPFRLASKYFESEGSTLSISGLFPVIFKLKKHYKAASSVLRVDQPKVQKFITTVTKQLDERSQILGTCQKTRSNS